MNVFVSDLQRTPEPDFSKQSKRGLEAVPKV